MSKVIHLDENEDVGIQIGNQYTVYGINLNFFIEGMPFYYICQDDRASYPVPNAAVLFEMSDPRPSKHWRFVFNQDQQYGLFLAKWANDEGFYERLIPVTWKYAKIIEPKAWIQKSIIGRALHLKGLS